VISFVKGGLRDLSISRTTFDWGVKVPGDEGHVMYVWIDALANYISALGYPEATGEGSDFDKFWPASLHVVGKDILRFHAVYWPAFLMAAGLPLPRRIFAHGWWTKDGEKISKSLGNVIDPVELVDKYGVDPTRFFLMSEVTFGSDGDFSDERMVYKVNANLSNELGNLNQRIMTLVYKNCDGATPAEIGTLTAEDEAMLAAARSLRSRTGEAISTQSIDRYVQHMISAVRDANRYIDAQAPWVLRKTDVGRMRTVLYVLMEVMRHVAILYQPLMPASSNAILDQLGVPADERDFAHLGREGCEIRLGKEVIKPTAVFPRFEVPVGAAA
jgi:methionyl-tRNA synthetase